jgi:hypothetical protein
MDPVTLIIIYVLKSSPAENNRRTVTRELLLTSICPKAHPDHHKAMQCIRSTHGNNYEAQLALAFDYVFQYLCDPFRNGDEAVEGWSDVQGSVDVADTEDTSVIHRFFADIVPARSDEPSSKIITVRYERVVDEAGKPDFVLDA